MTLLCASVSAVPSAFRPLPARLAAAACAAAALVGVAGTALAQGAVPAPSNVMNLATTASADVPMDLLAITFSTTRDGTDAAAVQQQLRQALDAALAEARKVARPGQLDVRTGNLALSPRYAPKGGLAGWQGSVQLHVEGRDMAAISQLAGRIGTLSIAQVRQGLSREAREKAEAETTAQAIARFRERAQAQAQLFGFAGYTLREVAVNADGGGFAPPVVAFKARAAGAPADEALPVEAGKATVTVSVSGSVTMTR
jgi:predicted secreted protein